MKTNLHETVVLLDDSLEQLLLAFSWEQSRFVHDTAPEVREELQHGRLLFVSLLHVYTSIGDRHDM